MHGVAICLARLVRTLVGYEPNFETISLLVTDSDSSETDTEELIRQEIRKKEEKRARLEARKKADGEATVIDETQMKVMPLR